jgi:hypothetical protein
MASLRAIIADDEPLFRPGSRILRGSLTQTGSFVERRPWGRSVTRRLAQLMENPVIPRTCSTDEQHRRASFGTCNCQDLYTLSPITVPRALSYI